MHIPDGVLSPQVWVPLAGVSAAAVGLAARKVGRDLDEKRIPMAGVLGAFVFAAQMINFPIAGGTTGHLLGAALVTVALGPWLGILIMSSVLITQCLLFADGGLTALGANIFNMGVIGCGVTTLVQGAVRGMASPRKRSIVAGAVGGFLAVFLGALVCGVELVASGTFPGGAIIAMGGVHAVLGVFEGVITAGALAYILAARPDVILGGET